MAERDGIKRGATISLDGMYRYRQPEHAPHDACRVDRGGL